MKTKRRKWLALLAASAMVLTMLPGMAFAAEEGNAAAIGNVEYQTVQAAVTAAKDGETVKLLRDVEKAVTLTKPKSITVNLNGRTITGKDTKGKDTYAIAVQGEGTELTVTGSGTLTGQYGVYANKNAVVNVSGGTVSGTTAGIYVNNGGTVHVSGGTVSGTANFGIYLCHGVVNVTGGTVSGRKGIMTYNSNKPENIDKRRLSKEINISGAAQVSGTQAGIETFNGTQLTVGGDAEIISDQYGITVWDEGTKLTVHGGKITGELYAVVGNGSADGTTIEINGGEITAKTGTAIFHPQVGDMTIRGGTITGVASAVQYTGAGQLTITGGRLVNTLDHETNFLKSDSQSDGTIVDGAALSIVSRGGGYQSSDEEVMNVTITGGELVSEHNSAVAVYRTAKKDGHWCFNADTELPNYLNSLVIKEGEDGSIPVFSGNSSSGVLNIDRLAMDVRDITGGTFSQDVNGYQKEGYVSHPCRTPESFYNVHIEKVDEIEQDWLYDSTHHWKPFCTGHEGCIAYPDHKAAHDFGDGVVTREPQIGVEGERTYTCGVCGATHTEPIPALAQPEEPGEDIGDDNPPLANPGDVGNTTGNSTSTDEIKDNDLPLAQPDNTDKTTPTGVPVMPFALAVVLLGCGLACLTFGRKRKQQAKQ